MAATKRVRADKPIAGNVQVRPQHGYVGAIQEPMGQAVLQSHEITAPLSEIAHKMVSDLRAIGGVLDGLEVNSRVRTIRPEPDATEPGLTGGLLAASNEIVTIRLMVETLANRIGAL